VTNLRVPWTWDIITVHKLCFLFLSCWLDSLKINIDLIGAGGEKDRNRWAWERCSSRAYPSAQRSHGSPETPGLHRHWPLSRHLLLYEYCSLHSQRTQPLPATVTRGLKVEMGENPHCWDSVRFGFFAVTKKTKVRFWCAGYHSSVRFDSTGSKNRPQYVLSWRCFKTTCSLSTVRYLIN